MTPTEALTAYEYGEQMVKVFPVRSLGPTFGIDLHGPLPFISIMAVGGTSLSNAEDYFKAGWNAFGIGGSLVNQQLVTKGNFNEIENRARQFVEIRDRTTLLW